MTIEKDKMVSLVYTLKEKDHNGRVIEEVQESDPLKFLYGAGQMLQHFEKNIEGKTSGDNFEFQLKPDEAYGEKRDEMVVDIPRSVFEVDGVLDEKTCQVGNQVPMADSQGRRLLGVVLAIKDDSVTMDFNHPMAGVELYFTGSITEVREASGEELEMYYGGGGCSTCGSHGSCDGHC